MGGTVYFLILLAVTVAGIIILAVLVSRNGDKSGGGETARQIALLADRISQSDARLAEEFERSRRELYGQQKDMRAETAESMKLVSERLADMMKANFEHQKQLTEAVNTSLNSMRTNNIEQNERMSRVISESISRMQESNEKRLDQMRATVDEKLTSTLTTRLDSSFKTVSDQLENVYKSLGEMRELSVGVTDNVTSLNRVLTNVKARGTWAEYQLAGILDQTIPNMYDTNVACSPKSTERVEFAVKIPASEAGGETTYLPIDSKFPIEDYTRLCEAADRADPTGVDAARKALEARVIAEAKDISKYINPPRTTPFAIMYLATEGLYAEVSSSRSGLMERLHNEFNILVSGPSTITALLNSLSVGFRAVAINEKANEVRRLLAAAKTQYAKFGEVLESARKKIEDAGKSLEKAQDRNRIIQKNLKGVEALETGEAGEVLGINEDSTDG